MTRTLKSWAVLAAALMAMGVVGASPAAAQDPTAFVPGRAQPWVQTGILVAHGTHLTAHGAAITSLEYVRYGSISGPDGQRMACSTQVGSPCLVPDAPYGALIGRIAGGEPFVVGSGYTVADMAGELELAVNDNLAFYADNSGGYAVHVRN